MADDAKVVTVNVLINGNDVVVIRMLVSASASIALLEEVRSKAALVPIAVTATVRGGGLLNGSS